MAACGSRGCNCPASARARATAPGRSPAAGPGRGTRPRPDPGSPACHHGSPSFMKETCNVDKNTRQGHASADKVVHAVAARDARFAEDRNRGSSARPDRPPTLRRTVDDTVLRNASPGHRGHRTSGSLRTPLRRERGRPLPPACPAPLFVQVQAVRRPRHPAVDLPQHGFVKEAEMDQLDSIISSLNAFAWGPRMLGAGHSRRRRRPADARSRLHAVAEGRLRLPPASAEARHDVLAVALNSASGL